MYEEYLRALLEPLGVYDLSGGTVNRAELAALGLGFDGVSGRLDLAEREALTATAEGEGLRRREALFARRSAAVTTEDRRAAIDALLRIGGDSLTPAAINNTLQGCGTTARAVPMNDGSLRVVFPDIAGIPAEFDRIQKIILDILPCHLAVEFYFDYLLWQECEDTGYTWEMIETMGHTWDSFQVAGRGEA